MALHDGILFSQRRPQSSNTYQTALVGRLQDDCLNIKIFTIQETTYYA